MTRDGMYETKSLKYDTKENTWPTKNLEKEFCETLKAVKYASSHT
jgi:hypothetical protein